jgi:photosystem II stability/assembly factor-like uncharacterized protein
MTTHALRRTTLLALLLPALLCPAATPAEIKRGPERFKRLQLRMIGPSVGGRVCRAAGVPGDPLTYYAATAAGGVWKSSDGGHQWRPVTDDVGTPTFGSLAIAPSDPNVIYAGSGEANIRGNVEVGNGIYKSSDAGKTWKHVWPQEGQIGTMIVHPTNPDVAYAAVLGKAFGANPQRGVYRTTDGGKSWKQVLKKNEDTGASDVCFDPSNPRVLFAGTWQTRRTPWSFTSGGPGSGLYTSSDGGDTWTQLVPPPPADSPDSAKDPAPGTRRCKGLPAGIWGKVGVAVAPSDPRRVYALIEADKGGLFRSNDGGKTWELANSHHALRQRAWYYTTFTIDPKNADVLWFPQVPLLKSIDGGKSLLRVQGPHHGDHHDLWIDPKNPKRILDSNDGGLDLSLNGGETWFAPPLPVCQFYHVSVDNRKPYRVAGTMQDIGTAQGPSNSLANGGIRPSAWYPVGGGEAGHTASDPDDPDVVYATEYGGYLTRYDHRTRQARSVGVYPYNPSGHAAENLSYRFQWTAPVLVSPHDPHVVYHAANVLFRTRDGGQTWTRISDDLTSTRKDRGKRDWSGGPITGDNTGVEVFGTIFALAESPCKDGKGVLWAGTDDGWVHVSRDGGKTWTNVTKNIPRIPKWGTVRCVEASPSRPGTAYVVVDNHRLDDRKPYLWKTDDFGEKWESLTENLRAPGFLAAVREDPKRPELLYAGGEGGLFFSADAGKTWEQLKLNLPHVTVTDLVVKDDDLVVATNGRSIWVLDDLTPLREWSRKVRADDVHLFTARPATRWRYHNTLYEKRRPGSAPNPPEGAVLHYSLKRKPKGEITLDVLDRGGGLVQRLTSKEPPKEPDDVGSYTPPEAKPTVLPTDPGLHRVVWNLRHKGAEMIKGARVDTGLPRVGFLAIPGTYTLRLTVEGKTTQTTLEVLPDPRTVAATLAELRRGAGKSAGGRPNAEDAAREVNGALAKQLKFALDLRDDITRLTRTVEQIRSVRKQLRDRNELLKDDANATALVKESKALVGKLDDLEAQLHNPKAEVPYDILAQKGGAKLYSQLAWLFEQVKDADGAPTQGMLSVYEDQQKLLRKYEGHWQGLKEDLKKLNAHAGKLDVPAVIVPRAAGEKPAGKR